jgi:hypothetical protein
VRHTGRHPRGVNPGIKAFMVVHADRDGRDGMHTPFCL